MTKDELLKKEQEELADAEHYEKMASECQEFHQIFRDIAKEERCHAALMRHIVEHL